MQIFVKPLGGKCITLNVEPDDTIEKIKAKLKEKEGFPIANQRIVFGGSSLENLRTLADCGIKNGAYVILIVTLASSG